MAEAFKSTWAGGEVLIPKTQVEAEAREAYRAGRTPNEACPYPFHTDAALHWMAIFILCMPLSTNSQPRQQEKETLHAG